MSRRQPRADNYKRLIPHEDIEREFLPGAAASGRLVPELEQPMLREIIVGSYRIVYRVISDQVQILTVVHGARRFPTSELGGTK